MADDENSDGSAEEGIPLLLNPATRIPTVEIPRGEELLQFSFRHIDLVNEKFSLSECTTEFFCLLMETIKTFSNWTVDDFQDQNNKEHRHLIDFRQTTELNGFRDVVDPDQFDYHEAWQFQLFRTELWRVHGILVDNTFFVIWHDPMHKLFPINNSN
jgi:hypothetical protein